MNVRERRLRADHDRISRAFRDGGPISVVKTFGDPPEKYQVRYKVRGLTLSSGSVMVRNEHLVEIYLTQSYPRMAPQCRMMEPIFHPNIAPHAICIGDHWAAGESLADLIVRIGEMITWQSYNTKSPLNGDAARWADLNSGRLPIDATPLTLPPIDPQDAGSGAMAEAFCQNCGGKEQIASCAAGHATCVNCRMECPTCRKLTCAQCGMAKCAVCGKTGCATCVGACVNCAKVVCAADASRCVVCGKPACADCSLPCPVCNRAVCLKDYLADRKRCRRCGDPITAVRVKVTCSSCKGVISVPHRLAGKTIRCPRCQSSVQVPEVKPPAA